MAIYFPQAVMTIRVILEDFGYRSDVRLQKPYTWSVVCKNITVNLNSYREADTFRATIDYKNFPFDPRIIRSCGVQIFLEDRKRIFKENNELDLLVPSEKNIIFQGFADTDKISLSEDSRTVELEGRDFTSLLIDREYLGEPINTSKPLDQVIQELLNQLPQTKVDPSQPGQGLLVENQTGEALPTLADLSGSKDALAGVKNPKKKKSYWDQIQDLVNDSGLIAYVAIDKLVIIKPRNLYSRDRAKVFVYGRNISSLEYERKLGRQKGFNVRVVCLNVEKKELLEAKLPEEGTEEWAKELGIRREPIRLPVQKVGTPPQAAGKSPTTGDHNSPTVATNISGGDAQQEGEVAPYFTFKVKDITSKEQLIKIGEALYEEMGRQQIEGKLATKELRVAQREITPDGLGKILGTYFDATKFRIGAPLEIYVDSGDLSGVNEILNKPPRKPGTKASEPESPKSKEDTLTAFLISRAYAPDVARALAVSMTKFQTPFYTKDISFTIDQEQGFKMDVGFINFIEIPESLRKQGVV